MGHGSTSAKSNARETLITLRPSTRQALAIICSCRASTPHAHCAKSALARARFANRNNRSHAAKQAGCDSDATAERARVQWDFPCAQSKLGLETDRDVGGQKRHTAPLSYAYLLVCVSHEKSCRLEGLARNYFNKSNFDSMKFTLRVIAEKSRSFALFPGFYIDQIMPLLFVLKIQDFI